MCEHDFDTLLYEHGVIVRRCELCGKTELHVEWDWVNPNVVQATLNKLHKLDEVCVAEAIAAAAP